MGARAQPLVLVDTSAFIEYLRGKLSARQPLEQLLLSYMVVLSDLVRLELLMGTRINEQKDLDDLLLALPKISVTPDLSDRAASLLPLVRRSGLNVGLIDYLICMQALNQELVIFSFDRTMLKLAKILGVRTLKW